MDPTFAASEQERYHENCQARPRFKPVELVSRCLLEKLVDPESGEVLGEFGDVIGWDDARRFVWLPEELLERAVGPVVWEGNHTAVCAERQRAMKEAHDAWVARWPNHCEKCMGAGVQSYTENQSPLGSGMYWPMQMTDPCWCTEEGRCPRCGHQHDVEWIEAGDKPCEACGWNWGEGGDDVCPQEGDDCACWMIEQREAIERRSKEVKG